MVCLKIRATDSYISIVLSLAIKNSVLADRNNWITYYIAKKNYILIYYV